MSKFSPHNTKGAKISNDQVLELRQLYHEEGWTQAQLARKYQVNVNTVGRIVRGESRQQVPMATESPEDIRKRLVALQDQTNQAAVNRLTSAAQKEYDSKVKPIKELEEFLDIGKGLDYGITKE